MYKLLKLIILFLIFIFSLNINCVIANDNGFCSEDKIQNTKFSENLWQNASMQLQKAQNSIKNNKFEKAIEPATKALKQYKILSCFNQKYYQKRVEQVKKELRKIGNAFLQKANYFRDQNEFEEARIFYDKSLTIREYLKNSNTECFTNVTNNNITPCFQIAIVFHNRGMLELNDWYYNHNNNSLKKAENYFYKAYQIRESLKNCDIKTNKTITTKWYEADSLHYLGNISLEKEKFDNAIKYYNDSIEHYTSYKDFKIYKQPKSGYSYALYGSALNYKKLGDLFLDKAIKENNNNSNVNNNLQTAEDYYNKALALRIECANNKPKAYISNSLAALGNVYLIEKDYKKAEKKYNESINEIKHLCNNNKQCLNDHIMNDQLLHAYNGLIEIYSTNPKNNNEKIIKLIELIRSKKFYDDLSTITIPSIPANTAILSIQNTLSHTIFVISFNYNDEITHEIYSIPKQLFLSKTYELQSSVLDSLKMIRHNSYVIDEASKQISEKSKDVYQTFPIQIQELFNKTGNYINIEDIYLSVDNEYSNFPFELLIYNEKNDYLGKTFLLPRIQGLKELASFEKVTLNNNNNIAIINPSQDLPTIKNLEIKNKKEIFEVHYDQVSKEQFLNSLEPDISIFHFSGHGINPDGLKLIDGTIHCRHIKQKIGSKFINKPLFFLNSCMSGNAIYMGGGEYQGISNDLFNLGASAIISSPYPVFTNSSLSFINSFYDNFLSGKTAGESIKKARSSEEASYYPWNWGLYIYTGNPNVVFTDNKISE